MEHFFDKSCPLSQMVRPCRRLLPDGSGIIDESWRKKIETEQLIYGSRGGGYLLTRISAQVPKGLKIRNEYNPGDDLSTFVDEYKLNGGTAIHVCTRDMARTLGFKRYSGRVKYGDAYGMKYVVVPEGEVELLQKKIAELYPKNNSNQRSS